jgi:hypothetical protein
MVKPGDMVMYRLHADDVKRLEELGWQQNSRGNGVCVGEALPLLAVKVWANEFSPAVSWGDRVITGTAGINGQVFLDGIGTYWVTSVPEGTGPGTWSER